MPDVNTRVTKAPSSPGRYADSKLRDSCHPCASSKVKCSKEKPTCARCESRGTTCQYLTMKRPGRRRENSINRTANKKSSFISPVAKMDGMIRGDGPETGSSRLNDTIQATQRPLWGEFSPYGGTTPPTSSCQANDPYLGFLPSQIQDYPITQDICSAAGTDIFLEDKVQSPPVDLCPEVEGMDLFMSAKDGSFKMSELDDSIIHTPNDHASLLITSKSATSIDLFPELPLTTGPRTTSGYSSSNTLLSQPPSSFSPKDSRNATPLPGKRDSVASTAEPSPCSCLDQALNILKVLSSPRSLTYNSSASSNSGAGTRITGSTIEIILMENKQSIEAISSIIKCSCAHDSFLLGILAVSTLKMLGRYAVAARAPPTAAGERPDAGTAAGGEAENNRVANSIVSSLFPSRRKEQAKRLRLSTGRSIYGGITGDEHEAALLERKAAQDVLGELHRVQNLVSQLSPRLKPPPPPSSWEGGDELGFLMDGCGELNAWSRPQQTTTGGYADDGSATTMAPFSASTLDRLENDLRKNLGSLSTDIIDRLRQR